MPAILDLCGDAPVEHFRDGAVLLTEGQNTGRLYVLAEGKLEVLHGTSRVAVLAEPGSIIGEMSLLLGVPHTATVRALGEVEVHVIADASAFLGTHPELAFIVARLLARRLNAAITYLSDLKGQTAASGGHWASVGEVLESLIHETDEDTQPGPERDAGGT